MNDIIYARMRETFGEIKERIESNGVRLDSLRAGVHLTGGGSILRGVGGLARDIFNLPACVAQVTEGFSGPRDLLMNPRLLCALGLLKC